MSKVIEDVLKNTFDIGINGFAPDRCETKLPSTFNDYRPLVTLLSTENGTAFREMVKELEIQFKNIIPTTTNLESHQKKYLYSVLSMIVHKYVWCNGVEDIIKKIPQYIGQPWIEVCDDLGLPCVLTHAAVDLYNWQIRHKDKKLTLDNLKSTHTMLGSPYEEWFYLVMVAIECIAGDALKGMYEIGIHLKNNTSETYDHDMITRNLLIVKNTITESVSIIERMTPDRCNPSFFFNELRIYLQGSSKKDNNKQPYFPDGLEIEGISHDKISFEGGSAAQSSLIQAFDVFLGVTHDGQRKEFLDGMRNYMPRKHREFLSELGKLPSVTEYAINNKNDEQKTIIVDSIEMLKNFRKAHIKLVQDYIMKFVKELEDAAAIKKKEDEEKGITSEEVKVSSDGTGGTNPMVFLPHVMNDTGKAARQVMQDTLCEKITKDTDDIIDNAESMYDIKPLQNVHIYISLAVVGIPIVAAYFWLGHSTLTYG